MKHSQPNFKRRIRLETLEARNLLAADVGHNFVIPYDVNMDGDISALDALNSINELERNRNGETGDKEFLSDVDGNGLITAIDIVQIINRIDDPKPDASELKDGIDKLAQSILSEDLPGKISPQAADRWLAKMEDAVSEVDPKNKGPFNRLDKNDDGEITKNEVREELWSKLSNADADQSESVTKEELREARPSEQDVERPTPDAQLAFDRLDANEDGALSSDEVSEKRWERLSKADSDENGTVTIEELKDHREEMEDGVQRPQPGSLFEGLDLNDDGKLTQDEVSELAWQRISQLDLNEDGAVTLEEITQSREDSESNLDGPMDGRFEEKFARLDVNRDGALTDNEVTGPVWQKIQAADANEDGKVTFDELKEHKTSAFTVFDGDYYAYVDLQPLIPPDGPTVYVTLFGVRAETAKFVTANNSIIEAAIRNDGVILGNGDVFEALNATTKPDGSRTYTGVDVVVEARVDGELKRIRLVMPQIDPVY